MILSVVNINVSIRASKGVGFAPCKQCGRIIEISRNRTHGCPIDEDEYPTKFRDVIVLCRALQASSNFTEWMRQRTMNSSVLLSFMSDIRGLADIKYEDHDYRFTKRVKNVDCVDNIEVE